jgi:hypothetical protein
MAEVKHATENGHWYKSDGTPAYTYINKKGEEKPTTLREARKENLKPSVTTIISCASAPQLVNWKIDQAILSSLTLSRNDDETEQEYLARIKADAQEQAKKAAERGTLIHAWVQEFFTHTYQSSDVVNVPTYLSTPDKLVFCHSAHNALLKETNVKLGQWLCEESFATERYGGKADLHDLNSEYLIDIKTKTWADVKKLDIWDSHLMQLAAYRNGLNIPDAKCGILYIHQETAESVLLWADEDKIQQGMGMFNALLDFYYKKTQLGMVK